MIDAAFELEKEDPYAPLEAEKDPFRMGPVNNERWLIARLYKYGLVPFVPVRFTGARP